MRPAHFAGPRTEAVANTVDRKPGHFAEALRTTAEAWCTEQTDSKVAGIVEQQDWTALRSMAGAAASFHSSVQRLQHRFHTDYHNLAETAKQPLNCLTS